MGEPINDGGPAFPKALDPYPNVQDIVRADMVPETGMSLRDYFAAKAMEAFVGSYEKGELTSLMRDIAYDAYDMADAMIAAREAKP